MPPTLTATFLLFYATITSATFLLFYATITSATTSQDSNRDFDCTEKWIHIRQLPPKFNLDLLLNCSQFPLFNNFCPYLSNHGLGQKTHNSSYSWYRTDPYMLELIFHYRMLEYPCLTSDPDLANAVYLPYYAGIDSIKYLFGPNINTSSRHGLDLFHYLTTLNNPQIWENNMGHDHFLIMARPAWDFTQPLSNNPPIFGTSFLELSEFLNITALTLEARAYPWQEKAIPYPTWFHPPHLPFLESWVNRVRNSKRTILMLYAAEGGVSSNPNIRRSIRLECANDTNVNSNWNEYSKLCEYVDCSSGLCEHDPVNIMSPMLQASFCLQPPEETLTRRSTFDGLLAGCIPVFFEELSSKRQYKWHLPEEQYDEFSVFIPKEDVVFKEVRILDVLMSISRDQVERMRQKVLEILPRVIYRKHGSLGEWRTKKDAFDIAVEGTLQNIKSKIKELST